MIAVLINSLAIGGAERVALTLLKEIHQRDHQTILICVDAEDGYEPPDFCEIIYLTNFNKLHHPIYKIIWITICAFRLRMLIRNKNIHAVQSHLNRANLINTASKIFGATHYAQIVLHTQLRFSRWRLIAWVKKTLFKWLYTKADLMVSISSAMQNRISDTLNLVEGQPYQVVIPNPHDIDRIKALAKAEPEGFTFDKKKKYLISAGRQIELKNVAKIIEAFSKVEKIIPDVELIILGDGPSKSFNQSIALREKLTHKIHFMGHMPNPFAYVSRCDLLVLASESEGLPNIIIESLICDVPVLSSDCPTGPREILSPDSDVSGQIIDQIEYAPYGVLFPTRRPDLMAEAMVELLQDESLHSAIKNRAREYVKNYAQKGIADRYLAFYPSIDPSGKLKNQE
ncbi:MAG: glycosyltransferase [Saprospiraceae bacterium]|nr:glycosyltransferase [Saprospiraceae bacterium]